MAASIATVILLLAGACGSGEVSDANAPREEARLRLPSQLVGLAVVPEDVSEGLATVDRAYIDTVAVFSLREDELLRASLQLSRFNRVARPDDSDFIGTIVGTIGGVQPVEYRVGEVKVYATSSTDQQVFTWFEGDSMIVLSVQEQFEFPRTLLRRLTDLDLTL